MRRNRPKRYQARYRNKRQNSVSARRRMGIVFAVALGWCGVHRFTLGQWQWGLAHIFLFISSTAVMDELFSFEPIPWLSLSAILGYYTAVKWWRMSDEDFAEAYLEPVEEEVAGKYLAGKTAVHPKVKSRKARRKILQAAQTSFEQFDYQLAAEQYEEALDMDLADGESRVLAAKCYSLLEDRNAAYRHLRKAVQLEADNLHLVDSDEGFAWLRTLGDFRDRRRNGFKALQRPTNDVDEQAALPAPEINILDRLEQLGRLKERGLLNDDEFAREKRRLLG